MAKVVFCIVSGQSQALKLVDEVKAAGFPNHNISVLMSDKSSSADFAAQTHTNSPKDGALAGAKIGGLLGGALGLLVGLGTLAIPGVGPFIAAGPLMGALSGTAFGVAVGGISGTLVGLGITEIEAKRFEAKLKEGKVLVAVHLENPEEVQRVKDLFQRAGAEDISVSTEAAPRVEKRADVPVSAMNMPSK